jgi:hypothetical protein
MNEPGHDEDYVTGIARVCHQAMKAFCETHGDHSIKDWSEAEDWQRRATINSVNFRLNNPDVSYGALHLAWMQEKSDDGWTYGETKDAVAKTHPSITPFDQLPAFEKQKDALVCAIVDALK